MKKPREFNLNLNQMAIICGAMIPVDEEGNIIAGPFTGQKIEAFKKKIKK